MADMRIDLLKAYRVTHSRVLAIEPFEAALRENTPLTSISEPKALTEYLSQISLKGDMVTEELKRVTTERDECKKSADQAKKATTEAWDEVTNLKKSQEKPGQEAKSSPPPEDSEEFFSFDNEVPRLEAELKDRQDEVETLKSRIEALERDLSVARESTEGMLQNLESATRELGELRETRDKHDAEIGELKSTIAASESAADKATQELETLRDQAAQSDPKRQESKLAELSQQKEGHEKKLGVLQGLVDKLQSQAKETEATVASLQTDVTQKTESLDTLQSLVGFLDKNLTGNAKWTTIKDHLANGKDADFEELRKSLAPAPEEAHAAPELDTQPAASAASAASAPGSAASKKKNNKKKKKGGQGGHEPPKSTAETPEPSQPVRPADEVSQVRDLETQVESLTKERGEKDAALDRLSAKLKGEEDLKEEIESLRDDLSNIGQDFVESKDKIKELSAEKSALEETISKLEKEIADVRTNNASQSADTEKAHSGLRDEFEGLKTRAASLETDLSAAQQLAATRFKDLTDLRDTLQKLQPELRNLRAESAELKSIQQTLTRKDADLQTLDGQHADLRRDVKTLQTTVSERESEVKTLNQKIRQETDSRLKAEERLSVAQSDLRYSEGKKQEAFEARERTAGELSKTQDLLKTVRAKLRDAESQSSRVTTELNGLKEDIDLKAAQHASAQSLMNSMRDQGAEMGMQMKEARERVDSLDEELADAHRLLSERTREAETMRRLLHDIEGRTDAKIRDFRERMEAAIEERDRAENEASTQGRRRARELEDLKNKVREAEKALRTAEEDKEELEHSQKDWQIGRAHV